jgi:hypothetical protein
MRWGNGRKAGGGGHGGDDTEGYRQQFCKATNQGDLAGEGEILDEFDALVEAIGAADIEIDKHGVWLEGFTENRDTQSSKFILAKPGDEDRELFEGGVIAGVGAVTGKVCGADAFQCGEGKGYGHSFSPVEMRNPQPGS